MTTLKIVCCYAPEDKKLMENFHAHLRVLEVQHVSVWYAHNILPGAEWERERDNQLQSAHLILLLISPDFLNSEQYRKTIFPSMERHKGGKVRVIPIILRPVHWKETPFGNLQPLPKNGKPVTDRAWRTPDDAFFDIVDGIKQVIKAEKLALPAQREHDDIPLPTASKEDMSANANGVAQLENIIQGFRSLREQIAHAAFLKIPQGFSIENCESQYHLLYGEAMIFLAAYLPQMVSSANEGFVGTVYKKARKSLQQRTNVTVWLARYIISPLAELEKLAAQIDACVATLEMYKQDYFMTIS